MNNNFVQTLLTYSFILGAIVIVIRNIILLLTKKKGQPGCDSTCPACEAKNIVRQMTISKKD